MELNQVKQQKEHQTVKQLLPADPMVSHFGDSHFSHFESFRSFPSHFGHFGDGHFGHFGDSHHNAEFLAFR